MEEALMIPRLSGILFLAIACILIISGLTDAGQKGVNMTRDIHWLGHDTFRITGEKTIYTDPFKIKKRDAADLILITHVHYDHCSPDDVAKIQGPDTVIVTPAECAEKLTGKVIVVKPGDTVNAAGVEVQVVPAYNTNKQFHTKDKGWVGYIFIANKMKIYIAGDTDHIPEMKTFQNVDIALLPVSGTYVMTADEAAMAAMDIKPKVALPMHYGSIVGSKKDAEAFAEKLKGKIEVVILREE
jgi:L-ascorbate metabolism protein UlaG (beta-lactamase superfamily)